MDIDKPDKIAFHLSEFIKSLYTYGVMALGALIQLMGR